MDSAILFDLDNTLIDRDGAFADFVNDSFPGDRQSVLELTRLDSSGFGDRSQLFARWLQLSGEVLDSSRLGQAIAERTRPNAELLRELEELAKLIKIGIVSNGSTVNQQAKWLAAGLDKVIPQSRLFISESVGSRKPNAAIFQHACEAMEVSCETCFFLGDQFDADIVGSRAVGMTSYWVRQPLTGQRLRLALAELGFNRLNIQGAERS